MERDEQILIAGGGVAALEAMLALRALADTRLSVGILAPEPHFWYRPLAVAEPFGLAEVRHFELSALANEAGAGFMVGELLSVDTARRIAYTAPGGAVQYEALLIACGALPRPAIPGAITFRGPADTSKIEQLLAEIEAGAVRRVAFVVPTGAVWSLPAYELALMMAARIIARGLENVSVALVTPEDEPLHLFGQVASDAVRALLNERHVAVYTRAYPAEVGDGVLHLVPDGIIEADRVVALPRLQGPRIGGVPQTYEGFVPVDSFGRVDGLSGVYAAGDITTFPVKQGGIAAQQADAAAEAIAGDLGAAVTPRPFRPVLRGLLVTGGVPSYLRAELTNDPDATSHASDTPLWWPPAKIVGHHLAPFLGRLVGMEGQVEPVSHGATPVEIELDESAALYRRDRLIERAVDARAGSSAARVGDVMSTDPLVVAPEDTLGEAAEEMCRRDVGSAIVAEYGHLIGILTSRDVLHAIAERVHSSEARVRQWMTAEPIAVSPTTTLAAAEHLMAEHGIHHLPVLDGEQVVGMIGARYATHAGTLDAVTLGRGAPS